MKQGMIPVYMYIETLIMTNDDEGFEQLALETQSIFVFLVAYFSNKIYNFCHKVRFFNKLLMAITAVAGQRSSPDLCFATKSIKIYDPRH